MQILPYKINYFLCQFNMTKTKQKTAAWWKTETVIHVSGFTTHPKFCRIYLTSDSAPDSTMWFGPPSQSMAVDANLKMYDKISNVFFLNHMYLSLVYYE